MPEGSRAERPSQAGTKTMTKTRAEKTAPQTATATPHVMVVVLPGTPLGGALVVKVLIQARRRGAALAQRSFTLMADPADSDAESAVQTVADPIAALFNVEVRRQV